MSDDIAFLRKKFNKSLKYLDRKCKTNIPYKRSNIISQDKDKNEEETNSGKGTQCFKCGDYEQIRPECPNFIRKQKKRLTIIWYDSESECEGETANNVMAYSKRYES